MDLDYLLLLQNFRETSGGFLVDFFSKMTFLGELSTVMVVMAVIYWAMDKGLGSYLLMGWSANRIVNGFLKVTACVYRPWIRNDMIMPEAKALTTATGYSFPSGHTMNAASVFGGGAVRKDQPRGLRITLGIIVILVAFSRNFLGVHTPQDVLVGAGTGLLVMWLICLVMRWVSANPQKDWSVVCIGIAISVAVVVYAAFKPYPADYDAAGALIVDGAKMANDTFKGVGYCAGFLTGWILERRFVDFSTENLSVSRKLTRICTGLLSYYAVSLIVCNLLKNLIEGRAGTFISCFLQVFYIVFLVPWCLKHCESK